MLNYFQYINDHERVYVLIKWSSNSQASEWLQNVGTYSPWLYIKHCVAETLKSNWRPIAWTKWVASVHYFIPSTNFTRMLCPYLLARELAPHIHSFLNSEIWMTCFYFIYIQGLCLVSSYSLTLSSVLSNDSKTVKSEYSRNRALKKLGLN